MVLTLVSLVLANALPQSGLAQARQIDGPGRQCSDGLYGTVQCLRAEHLAFDLCQTLRHTARHHFLDEAFFARLLWQDSRFDLEKISADKLVPNPELNSDKPGLGDVSAQLNPAQIIEKTGRYLAYLIQEDGNVGLAAMAYDAGERGAFGFMAGNVALRQRSVEFVQLVTGLSAETWRNAPPAEHDFSLSQDKPFMEACLDLVHQRVPAFAPPATTAPQWGVALGHSQGLTRAQLEHLRETDQCQEELSTAQVRYVPAQHRFAGRRALWIAQVAQSDPDTALSYCDKLRQSGCPCRVVVNR